jgi:hypothetical protein
METIFDWLDNEQKILFQLTWLRESRVKTPSYYEKLAIKIVVEDNTFVADYIRKNGTAEGLHPQLMKYAKAQGGRQ